MAKKTQKFNNIDSVPNLPQMEKETIKYWEKIDVVELLKKERKNEKEKVYYDGPITANNLPHYGHVIQWTIKDLIPRYWSMQNYYVSRNMGWDCQGIPVEYEVEKALGFTQKDDIENYGVAKFNALCRESVTKYRDSIFYYEKRIGRWFDESDMYYTMDRDYIESMWWSLKELYDKGLLYEGHKVIAYSTRAGTTLSTHEVTAGGYKEIEDPYITVKFKLKADTLAGQKLTKPTSVLAWTTTPWTMPGHLMLAVGKDINYVLVESGDENFILAKDIVSTVFDNTKEHVNPQKNYKILAEFRSSELIDKKYVPPFDHFKDKADEGCFKIIYADHVSTEEGTGIVHLAPYGAEDFEIFMDLGIKLFDYLDDAANFTDLIPEYTGLFYKKANSKIIKDLIDKNLLFSTGKYLHRMPMCWRTDTPLIYKPIKSWYVAVTKIKDRLLKANDKINWVPDHVGTGRAGDWIKNARDWALSRKRYWGTPLPLWINDVTNEYKFIGSFAELKELAGLDEELKDPHKPYVDEITWVDKKNGGTFRRIPDVIDVWYDSGAMPFAQQHYPFENKDLLETKFPAEFVSEMYEQARLWFYTMLVINIALFDKLPYENVVAHGVMLAKDGKKLSKSKRNFPPMDEVLDTFGGDVLRYFILNSPVVQAESARFHNEVLKDARKEFFIPLWNCLKYFVMYANSNDFEQTLNRPSVIDELDLWILARLDETTNLMTEKLDNYIVLDAARALHPFVTDLSTWYIRRSRDKIRNGNVDSLTTLYYVLVEFSKLMAPLLPFISEKMYEVLQVSSLTNLKSIHLDLYPKATALSKDSKNLISKMQNTRDIVSLALSVRDEESIKIRQPLSTLYVEQIGANKGDIEFVNELVLDEVNVKNVLLEKPKSKLPFVENTTLRIYLDTNLTEELKIEGAARDMIRKIQSMRKKQGLNVSEYVKVTYEDSTFNNKVVKEYGSDIIKKVQAKEFVAGSEYNIERL